MTRVVLKIQYSHKTIKKPRTKEKRKNENLIKSNLKTKTSPLKKTSSIGQNDTSPPKNSPSKNSPPKTSPSKTTNSPKITSPQTDPISSNEFHDVVKSSNMAGDNNKMTPKEKKRPKKVNLFDTGNDREGTKTSIPTTEQRNRSWSSSGPEVKVSSLKDIMSHQSDQHDLNSNSSPREKKNFKPNRRRQARGQDIIRWEQENTIEISKRSPLSPWGQARPVNIRTSPDHGPLNSPLSKSSSPIKSPIKVDEFVPQTPPKSQTVSYNVSLISIIIF